MTHRGHDYVPARNALSLHHEKRKDGLEHPRGRCCKEPGCNATISRYNAGDSCWCHEGFRRTG